MLMLHFLCKLAYDEKLSLAHIPASLYMMNNNVDFLTFSPLSAAVERSQGSAYMLSKYEEEPDSPGKFAEMMNKTTAMLTQGTESVLIGSKSSAIYLRQVFLCGIAGRAKSKNKQ